MNTALLNMLKKDFSDEQLIPEDILIIDMDTFNYANNKSQLNNLKCSLNGCLDWDLDKLYNAKYNFLIHTAGAANPEDFFRKDSVVYSSVRRAKGNETFVVYIVNAQKCFNSLRRRSDRNALFTAITRSKGWVRVLGYGEDMGALVDEFKQIKDHDFKLYFEEYPDKDKLKEIFLNNRDVARKDVEALSSTKQLVNKLTTDNGISKLKLMQEIFGMSREQLLAELEKHSGEE